MVLKLKHGKNLTIDKVVRYESQVWYPADYYHELEQEAGLTAARSAAIPIAAEARPSSWNDKVEWGQILSEEHYLRNQQAVIKI